MARVESWRQGGRLAIRCRLNLVQDFGQDEGLGEILCADLDGNARRLHAAPPRLRCDILSDRGGERIERALLGVLIVQRSFLFLLDLALDSLDELDLGAEQSQLLDIGGDGRQENGDGQQDRFFIHPVR